VPVKQTLNRVIASLSQVAGRSACASGTGGGAPRFDEFADDEMAPAKRRMGREGFEPSTLGLRVPCSTN
jgi:hypothetical protein